MANRFLIIIYFVIVVNTLTTVTDEYTRVRTVCSCIKMEQTEMEGKHT